MMMQKVTCVSEIKQRINHYSDGFVLFVHNCSCFMFLILISWQTDICQIADFFIYQIAAG